MEKLKKTFFNNRVLTLIVTQPGNKEWFLVKSAELFLEVGFYIYKSKYGFMVQTETVKVGQIPAFRFFMDNKKELYFTEELDLIKHWLEKEA